MKKTLLMTTALVALVSASNTQAQTLPDLNVSGTEKITEGKGVAYKTISVAKGGELTLDGGNVKTSAKDQPTTDIIINGTLNLNNGSVLEAGSDNDDLANNSNILLEGAKVGMENSDLEANGNITIKNTNLTSKSQNPEEYGIWADGDITLEGGETTLSNSYLASGGNMTIQSGTIHGSGSSDIRLSSDGKNKHKLDINGGNITLEDYAGIYSSGKDGQYNTLAADININGGNITVKDGGEITLTGNADMNIGSNANITMDYTDVAPDNNHDGGILHEGQNGDINISGGVINLTGEVAKIERGGYDGDWIYSTTGETLMSEDDFYTKTGKYLDQATDEDIQKAGLNPAEIDKNQYHVSSGDINISGGEINLKDGARISLTEKNTGDLNISGGKISGTEIGNYGKGNVNISGGEITATDIGAEQGNVTISNGLVNIIGGGEGLYARDKLNIKGGTVSIEGNDAKFSDMLAKNGKIDAGTVNLNHGHLGVDEALDITGGEINMNVGEIDAQTVNVSGGKINMIGETGLSGSTIAISGGEITQQGTQQDRSGIWGTSTISGDAVINMKGYASIDENSTLSINGGTINVSGTDNVFGSVNDVAMTGGKLNIAQGADLSLHKLESTMPDADYTLGTINSKGHIDLAGKIKGNVNMADGGVMNIGLNNAVIEGDAIFNSGSTLKLEIADSGNGSLTANNITGKEGSKLALNITKKMELNDVLEDVVLFNGNVTNNFTEELSNNRYSVQKNSDGKSYDITYIATASDIVSDAGGTASNASTAEAWDGMTTGNTTAKDVATKLRDLSENDGKAYVDALTAVAPEVAPMVQKTQTETANQVFGAVSTRLTGGSISTGREGMSSGDNIFERAAMWVQGLFNKSKLDDTSKSYGFDADSSGVAMGAEKYVTEDTKLGIGYAYTNTDIDGFMRNTDVDTHTAFVYGEYKPSNWYVNGIMSYGWSDYSEDKTISGIGVKADYDVETFGLQAMTGYDMQLKHFGLTPEVGLRYVHISQDGYTDSADQKVSGNDSDILTGVIGAKVSKTWTLENGMNIKPEARIAATYDLMNDDVNSVVTLANGSAYAVEGDSLDRFGMEFGAGVTAEVNDNVEFALGYEGKLREDYQDHTGLVNLKYKF